MSDNEHAILNLSPDEKRAFSFLFAQADKDQLGVVTGENAVTFFERTHVSPNVLGEIWQLADTENRGLLTKPGFCMVLRLIGHYQAGREPSTELAFKPGPIPKFEGLTIPGVGGPASTTGSGLPSPSAAGFPPAALQPQASGNLPVRVPPLDPLKVQQYSGLFERSGAQNGQLDGATAKAIFERAGLPNEVLGRIWMLADREQRGALDQTEFIVAMHMLTSMKTRTMTALPTTLPPGLYEAAARRGGPPPARQPNMPTAIPRQISGSSAGAIPRTQSPLARPGYGAPPGQPPQATSAPWLITPADKSKFDQFFNSIDTQRRGVLTGEQAVSFFSDSRLPEETLAQIWDLADINSEGQLNKDEFAVAMYLIRQQRAPNPAPLPAFLPPGLVPPSMRKQQQQTQSTAPAFDNAANSSGLPKSAADDLFGLDEPSSPAIKQAPVLQPQTTGMSASRDPFSGGSPATPSSPPRFQAPQIQSQATGFKPFQPTSAFGASLASQNTGGSFGSNQAATSRAAPPMPQSSGADDLLGDNDTSAAESGKLTTETTELANMSNQIGNLRSQMEQTQAKKSASQAEATTMNTQKRDLEIRLQQFRGQYEQEVRAVKELEQQLAASRESTKKLSQELAMLEGSYQDLQTQHQTVSQELQKDQRENANLKQRISQINAEVTRLKPEIEKLKLDARQQKGMVSINKKQLATGEGERDRLQSEKADLEREATEHAAQARSATFEYPEHNTSNVVSPAASVMSANNPFFVKPSQSGDLSRSASPITAPQTSTAPNPSAFDAIFGPSAAFASHGQGSGTSTPPTTSFGGRGLPSLAGPHGMSDSMQSVSSRGEHTPSATPPLSEAPKEASMQAEPPPAPEEQQFSASHLPVVGVDEAERGGSDTSSLRVLPPASRAGGVETPREEAPATSETTSATFAENPSTKTAAHEGSPGAFPEATPLEKESQPSFAAKDDFDSAFAGFSVGDKAAESTRDTDDDPFAPSSSRAATNGVALEFPEIKYLEPEDSDSDDDTDRGFGDDFAAPAASSSQAPVAVESVAPAAATLPPITAQTSPPTYDDSDKPSHGGTGEHTEENQFPREYGGLLPAREDPTSPSARTEEPAVDTAVREVEKENDAPRTLHTPFSSGTHTFPAPPGHATAQPSSSANAFDDFDAFDDLSEAKEADKASDFDFSFSEPSGADFNPAFDSPAASMSTTLASAQATPSASRILPETSNGFSNFQPTASTTSVFGSGAATSPVGTTAQHDWDAIFSGLDNSKPVDTTLPASDPWGASPPGTSSAAVPSATSSSMPKPKGPDRGGALTPGTEHDDPILKRLTGMGYPRGDALDALERFDYDINRAVDHLSGPP